MDVSHERLGKVIMGILDGIKRCEIGAPKSFVGIDHPRSREFCAKKINNILALRKALVEDAQVSIGVFRKFPRQMEKWIARRCINVLRVSVPIGVNTRANGKYVSQFMEQDVLDCLLTIVLQRFFNGRIQLEIGASYERGVFFPGCPAIGSIVLQD